METGIGARDEGSPARQRCVGGIVRDGTGRLLVIRRGHPPGADLWSLPGGRVEPGESDAAAVIRELREETGLAVMVGELVGSVRRPGPPGIVYDIYDYAASLADPVCEAPAPRAGDDAREVRWVTAAELRALPTTPGLLAALAAWGVLAEPA